MPRRRSRSKRVQRPAQRRTHKNNRGSRNSQHLTSIVISTLQTKQSHNREEVYPIALKDLIDRSNVGSDVDVRLTGYTLSCSLATGNDCSTVSINVGHFGPWVRRGDSISDTFDQQFIEHTIRGKSCLFRKFLIGTSERQYLNPDTATNFLYIRIRDPCGVIPGVVIKLEFRAFLMRRTPSAFFANASLAATDRYEDQDVSSGTQPSPGPPSAVKHAPLVIRQVIGPNGVIEYIGADDPSNNQWVYTNSGGPTAYTVSYSNPKQVIGAIFSHPRGSSDLQSLYNTAGYDGTITEI